MPTEPILIRPPDAIVPVKSNGRYLIDAVNNLLLDGQTTRELISKEGIETRTELEVLAKEIQRLNFHLQQITGIEVSTNEIVE